nr:uncharacterized protein LOC129493076 isoform X4 [Symphalangus syndactylus]
MKDSSVDLLTEENNTNYKPWPSVVVKATDVRCQPLASCLTVEGYSTDWTESFILEVKKALVGSQFFDWNSTSSCLGI